MKRHNKGKTVLFSGQGLLIALFQHLGAFPSRVLLRLLGGYKVTMHIRGRLASHQRYIVVANHQSMLDPFAIFALLPLRHRLPIFPIKFMARPTMYHKPWLKPFMFALGSFPAHVKHHPHHTYGVEGSIKLLRQGYNVCIFPEGTRTVQSESRARSGISRILQEYPEAALVLVHLQWRLDGWRRHITVTIASPPPGLDSNNPAAIMQAVYSLQQPKLDR